ncbi:MAG: T9SS type A sorting domain-containing protein [Bacteroidota bacterium]|nr:T9SS type A sorting domain-containing protein [Bacteroidota bacterium]
MDFFAGGYVVTDTNLEATNLMIPFSSDLQDRGVEIDSAMSPTLYRTFGPQGSRIFTLEYKNSGFYSGELENEILKDYVNFQLRLHEDNGNIEVHIGPYSVEIPGLDFEGFTGPVIGLVEDFSFYDDSTFGEIIVVTGDPSNPDVVRSIDPAYLVWPIPENTVYTFTRNTTAVDEQVHASPVTYYYPNPAINEVNLYPQFTSQIISPVCIYNSAGRLVTIDKTVDSVDLHALTLGIYELCFETIKGHSTQRIIKIQ